MRSTTLSLVVVLGTVAYVPLVHSAEPAPVNVAEIQAKHDRAFIRELSDYLRQNPEAEDRGMVPVHRPERTVGGKTSHGNVMARR